MMIIKYIYKYTKYIYIYSTTVKLSVVPIKNIKKKTFSPRGDSSPKRNSSRLTEDKESPSIVRYN